MLPARPGRASIRFHPPPPPPCPRHSRPQTLPGPPPRPAPPIWPRPASPGTRPAAPTLRFLEICTAILPRRLGKEGPAAPEGKYKPRRCFPLSERDHVGRGERGLLGNVVSPGQAFSLGCQPRSVPVVTARGVNSHPGLITCKAPRAHAASRVWFGFKGLVHPLP